MSEQDPNEINRLIGEFLELQERWESDPNGFDWTALQALARKGAFAYNEGAGPAFHTLAIDGAQHGELHERFLVYSVQAGFDPFKLSRMGSGTTEIPVIDHASLAEAAQYNPASARIRALLMELACAKFEPLAQEMQSGKAKSSQWLYRVIEACAESIPLDLLERIAPELAQAHHGEAREQTVDPIEGYLSTAETIVESNSKPYG